MVPSVFLALAYGHGMLVSPAPRNSRDRHLPAFQVPFPLPLLASWTSPSRLIIIVSLWRSKPVGGRCPSRAAKTPPRTKAKEASGLTDQSELDHGEAPFTSNVNAHGLNPTYCVS